jgi:hypothetical protein
VGAAEEDEDQRRGWTQEISQPQINAEKHGLENKADSDASGAIFIPVFNVDLSSFF